MRRQNLKCDVLAVMYGAALAIAVSGAGAAASDVGAGGTGGAGGAGVHPEKVISVLDGAVFQWTEGAPELTDGETYTIRFAGQSVDASVQFPDHPRDPANMQRIMLEVEVEPIPGEGQPLSGRPGDPWPRLGSVLLVTDESREGVPRRGPNEIEVLRFVTGFGSRGVFQQDVTALAPLLSGPVTIRTVITTFSESPGWRASVRFRLSSEGLGAQRPRFAQPLLTDFHMTAARSSHAFTVVMPGGMQTPRLRILSTGHATDGHAGNEFLTSPHVLRINGEVVARWRPWREGDGSLRERNLWAGRRTVAGRVVWSSDLGRSGWLPGSIVEPMWIPLPELTPGRHRIELSIEGIRPEDPPDETGQRHHGYWAVSAILLADEVWVDP